MTWHEQQMLVLDLETTAKEPDVARIVQASLGYVGGGEPTDVQSIVVNPGIEVPAEAAEIHGYTTERVRVEGVAPEMALGAIALTLQELSPDQALVIFNARYDMTVLDREFRRHGLDFSQMLASIRIMDPHVTDKHLERYREGSRKLDATCAHYRVILDQAHDATSDAISAGRLAWRQAKNGQVVRRIRNQREQDEWMVLHQEWEAVRDDIVLLHESERCWAEAQAEQLQRYLHEGNPQKGVPPQPHRFVDAEWPIIPVRD